MLHGSDHTTVSNVKLYKEFDDSVHIGKPGLAYKEDCIPDQVYRIPKAFIYSDNWKGELTVSDITIPKWLAIEKGFTIV